MELRRVKKAVGGGALVGIGVLLLNNAAEQASQGNYFVGGILGIIGGALIIAGMFVGGE